MIVKLFLIDWTSYTANKTILIMILLKYFSRTRFTHMPNYGNSNIWYVVPFGSRGPLGKLFDIKYPFVLMMPSAKLKFPIATLNIFIQPQRKVWEMERDLTWPP